MERSRYPEIYKFLCGCIEIYSYGSPSLHEIVKVSKMGLSPVTGDTSYVQIRQGDRRHIVLMPESRTFNAYQEYAESRPDPDGDSDSYPEYEYELTSIEDLRRAIHQVIEPGNEFPDEQSRYILDFLDLKPTLYQILDFDPRDTMGNLIPVKVELSVLGSLYHGLFTVNLNGVTLVKLNFNYGRLHTDYKNPAISVIGLGPRSTELPFRIDYNHGVLCHRLQTWDEIYESVYQTRYYTRDDLCQIIYDRLKTDRVLDGKEYTSRSETKVLAWKGMKGSITCPNMYTIFLSKDKIYVRRIYVNFVDWTVEVDQLTGTYTKSLLSYVTRKPCVNTDSHP